MARLHVLDSKVLSLFISEVGVVGSRASLRLGLGTLLLAPVVPFGSCFPQ